MPVFRALSRAILGAFAGICVGLFPGILIVAFIVHAVLRLGSPSQERFNLYFAVSAIAGAISGAILGLTIGERELSSGSRQVSDDVNRRFFHPLGLLIGLACGAIFGATFASLFVYSPRPTDAHAALVITCIAAILGGVGGGFIGPSGWMMVGGALAWIPIGGTGANFSAVKGLIPAGDLGISRV
jgi:hypothetical protein